MSSELEREQVRANTNELRAQMAEHESDRYRRAFLHILEERFTNLDATIASLLEVLSTSLDVGRVGFWVFDEEGTSIYCTHQYQSHTSQGTGPMLLKRSDYPIYFAEVSKNLTLSIPDATTDPRTCELLSGYLVPLGIFAMLDVPVRAFGRFIGILCQEHTQGIRHWTLEDQVFAAGVATQVALAFERDRMRSTQQKLLQRSLYDQDTQLPNNVYFENEVGDRLTEGSVPFAIAVARIDQYKLITDTFGRHQSLTLLRLAIEKLRTRLPEDVVLARTAPDELSLLISQVSSATLTTDLARWLVALREPLMIDEEKTFFTLSTGIALCDPAKVSGECNAEQLIADAGLAMKQAKQGGGSRTVNFATPMRERLEKRMLLEQDLRRGMAAREFEVHFQPIVDLRTLCCVGSEALLRWRHPTQGLLTPCDFIETAMESGAMLELGRRALRAACEGLARMRAQTQDPSLTVSVNMSAPELLATGTPKLIYAELDRVGLLPDSLTIEITEAALLTDLDQASEALSDIKAGGVHVSLDDFGTAFSSLTWMHKLPIDSIKIDRSFVEGIPENSGSMTLVRAIADLSHAFNRGVIAEGIETESQLRAVREMNITLGQGYLFSRAEAIECCTREWLHKIGAH